MNYKNLTIKGKTDGFGCQYNAVLSGMAFCDKHRGYRYIHTPFSSVSHGYTSKEKAEELNSFIGIPDNRHGKKIHISYKYMSKVFKNPVLYYDEAFLEKIRNYYWLNKKPVKSDIVVHIRRGDMHDKYCYRGQTRYQSNQYYNSIIPKIVNQYSDSYTIAIHSEGEFKEFQDITLGWHKSITDRVVWKLGKSFDSNCRHNLISAFHDMVCAKVLVQSKSGLSYTAGLLNNNVTYFTRGNMSMGQKIPLKNWRII